jgi:hypothetical protein
MSRQRKALREQTRQLLDALGDDANQVANSLAAQGVHGTPHHPQRCPIARYMGAVVGGDNRVDAIAVHHTVLFVRPAKSWLPPVRVTLSRAVRDFVTGFDEGRFPALQTRTPAPGRRVTVPSEHPSEQPSAT